MPVEGPAHARLVGGSARGDGITGKVWRTIRVTHRRHASGGRAAQAARRASTVRGVRDSEQRETAASVPLIGQELQRLRRLEGQPGPEQEAGGMRSRLHQRLRSVDQHRGVQSGRQPGHTDSETTSPGRSLGAPRRTDSPGSSSAGWRERSRERRHQGRPETSRRSLGGAGGSGSGEWAQRQEVAGSQRREARAEGERVPGAPERMGRWRQHERRESRELEPPGPPET